MLTHGDTKREVTSRKAMNTTSDKIPDKESNEYNVRCALDYPPDEPTAKAVVARMTILNTSFMLVCILCVDSL